MFHLDWSLNVFNVIATFLAAFLSALTAFVTAYLTVTLSAKKTHDRQRNCAQSTIYYAARAMAVAFDELFQENLAPMISAFAAKAENNYELFKQLIANHGWLLTTELLAYVTTIDRLATELMAISRSKTMPAESVKRWECKPLALPPTLGLRCDIHDLIDRFRLKVECDIELPT